jgi:hypothetical protein
MGTYTFMGTGIGRLGNSPLTDAEFVISVVANTDQIFEFTPNIFVLPGRSSSIDVSGVGSATFITGRFIFSNAAGVGAAGFREDDFITSNYLGTQNSASTTYELTTSIGPILDTTPTGAFLNFSGVPSTAGPVALVVAENVTFTAVVGTPNATVPEPTSLAIFGVLGMAGIAARRMRKQNA